MSSPAPPQSASHFGSGQYFFNLPRWVSLAKKALGSAPKRMISTTFYIFGAVALATGLAAVPVRAVSIVNGSFETGDFTGWIPLDLSDPFDPLSVQAAGNATNFSGATPDGSNIVIPTDGGFAATNGFDGNGPGGPAGAIGLSQDVGVLHAHAILEFDYRAGWDLLNYGATLDRTFAVLLEPFGGGSPIATFSILTAFAGTYTQGPNQDTGPLSASIDLSAYAGTNSRLTFKWTVPEDYTGPANAQLDNVRLTQGSGVNVPGPLPILGLAAAFGFSRKLRKRIKLHKGTSSVSTPPGA